ncbi:MAG: hypothetical protein LBM59_01430 [Ruminococcus sp.]|jgi:hypothetical protein|nr:hypothetical protein [Ruminococcus sp.]
MKLFIFFRRYFHVDGSRREKLFCKLTLALSGIILTVLCLAGYAVVYARCYDIMNDTPLTIIDYNEEETVLTFLGTRYKF